MLDMKTSDSFANSWPIGTRLQIQNTSNWKDTDIFFDARSEFEINDIFFDCADYQSPDSQLAAKELADTRVPITEDFRRSAQQLVNYFGRNNENKILTKLITQIFPDKVSSFILMANSLYTAITQQRNIDTATLNILGLASYYLPEQFNVFSQLAAFIRSILTEYTDNNFIQQFLGDDDNQRSTQFFTILAVTSIVAGRLMKNEEAPQRQLLKMPAMLANMFIRANYYWSALTNIAECQVTRNETQQKTKANDRNPAFEADTLIKMTSVSCQDELSCSSPEPQLTSFSSNSTAINGKFETATVLNSPIAPEKSPLRLSLDRQLNTFAIQQLSRWSGISLPHDCSTISSTTVQHVGTQTVTNIHYNTKCNALSNSKTSVDNEPRFLSHDGDTATPNLNNKEAITGTFEQYPRDSRPILVQTGDFQSLSAKAESHKHTVPSFSTTATKAFSLSANLNAFVTEISNGGKSLIELFSKFSFFSLKFPSAEAAPVESKTISKSALKSGGLDYDNTYVPTYPSQFDDDSINVVPEYIQSFYVTIDDAKLISQLDNLIAKNRKFIESKDNQSIVNGLLEYLEIIANYMYENSLDTDKTNYGKFTLQRLLLVLDKLPIPENIDVRIMEMYATVAPLLAHTETLPQVVDMIVAPVITDANMKMTIGKLIDHARAERENDTTTPVEEKNVYFILKLIKGFNRLIASSESEETVTLNNYKFILKQLKRTLIYSNTEQGKHFSFVEKIKVNPENNRPYSSTLTQDPRGSSYPSIEEQIASELIRNVNWYEDNTQYLASYSKPFDARKSLVTYALVVSNISDVSQLPVDWYRGDNPSYLLNHAMNTLDLYREIHGNGVIIDAANHFYQSCIFNNDGIKENFLDIEKLSETKFKFYNNEQKLILLQHYLTKNLIMDIAPETTMDRFYKASNLLTIIFLTNSVVNKSIFSVNNPIIKPHHSLKLRKKLATTSSRVKTFSGRGEAARKTTVETNEFVKGPIGKAEYEYDKSTKNLVIRAHGMPFRTEADGISSAAKLSKSIDNIAKGTGPINKITLQSCYSGSGGRFSQAQVVADRTNVNVSGFKGKYTQQGGGPQDGSGGRFKIFEPTQDRLKQAINQKGNTILGKPGELGVKLRDSFRDRAQD